MISDRVRVRFAPSPTGYLHVGGLRTALYNYLFAKRNNGSFILRIEDTDRARFVEGAVENLIDTLKWSGLTIDEGPNNEGVYGPYTQSERLLIYQEQTQKLIDSGNAYYCFCSKQRLEELREERKEKGLQPVYDKLCLHLSKDQIKLNIDVGLPYVVRLNVKPSEKIYVNDLIRGNIEFDSSTVDDQVLMKSDGYPTYHLANVVDDHFMKITHVIRGEEWLPSTPKHVLLYKFFGWEVPEFAHLPLLLNPDRSKLSKRQGDVAVEDYRSKGYLKEALINFVALLGWNAGDDKEFYYLNELVENFSLERVNKAGAVFNLEKLDWLNAEHLRAKDNSDLLMLLRDELNKNPEIEDNFADDYLVQVIEAMRERVKFVKEIVDTGIYFFIPPVNYDEASVAKNWKSDSAVNLSRLNEKIVTLENPVKDDFENALRHAAVELGTGAGKIIHPLRIALSGVSGGPGVFDIAYILGKEECSRRIQKAIEKLG